MKIDQPMLLSIMETIDEALGGENQVAVWNDEKNQVQVVLILQKDTNHMMGTALASAMLSHAVTRQLAEALAHITNAPPGRVM